MTGGRHMNRSRRWLIVGALTAVIGSVLSSAPSSAATPPRRYVQADDFRYCLPSAATCVSADTGFTIHIRVGTQVVWYYNDNECDAIQACPGHNVAFASGSGPIRKAHHAVLFVLTFNTAGTYNYHCAVHGGSGMTGTVIVHSA
jgi:Copper binding proteins, plastocyanin/azurin family